MSENKPLEQQKVETPLDQQPEQNINPVQILEDASKARQQVIAKLDEVLLSVVKGHSLNQKKLIKALYAVSDALKTQEQVITSLSNDMLRIIGFTASSETHVWTNSTMIQALLEILDKEGVVTEEKVRNHHTEEIVPKLLKKFQERDYDHLTEDHSEKPIQTSPQISSEDQQYPDDSSESE